MSIKFNHGEKEVLRLFVNMQKKYGKILIKETTIAEKLERSLSGIKKNIKSLKTKGELSIQKSWKMNLYKLKEQDDKETITSDPHQVPKVDLTIDLRNNKNLSLSSRVVSPPVDTPPSCGTTDKTYLSKNPTAKPPTLVYTGDRKIKNIQIAQSEDTNSGILYYRRHFEQQDCKKSSSPPKNIVQNLQNFQPSQAQRERAERYFLDLPRELTDFREYNSKNRKYPMRDISAYFDKWLEAGKNHRQKWLDKQKNMSQPPTKMELTPEKSWPYGDTKSNIPTPAPKKQPAYVPYKMPEPEPIAYDDYLKELEERFGTQIVNDLLINRNKRSNLCSM